VGVGGRPLLDLSTPVSNFPSSSLADYDFTWLAAVHITIHYCTRLDLLVLTHPQLGLTA
jgi:hypothetical protein